MRTPNRRTRTRSLSATVAVAATLALLGAGPAVAQDASGDTGAQGTPRTGFELSGGERWTTLDEETAFLDTVVATSDRAEMDVLATTEQGRPIRLVRIGDPVPEAGRGGTRGRVSVLLLCLQHGNEPSGREACLTTVRDLALSDDPAVERLLSTASVLVMPTANPDGRAANTRGNGDGVDINRDHLALETGEARTIAAVLRDHQPDIVYDLHEYGPTPPYYDRDFLSLWPRNLNAHPDLRALAEELSEDYVRPRVETDGFSSGVYGLWTDPETGEPIRQVAGDGQERILRNAAGVKNAVGLLVETRTRALTEEELADPALNNRRRVDSQLSGIEGAFDFVVERGARAAATVSMARNLGIANRGPVYFGGADNEEPAPEEIERDRICGYRLTSEQLAEHGEVLHIHGLRVRQDADGAVVPLAQQLRNLVPLLLDERADFSLTVGEPLSRC
ncbi:M14 family metallopeptidase [Actinoalloteichus spitiensis]|uniref:M14 family metallopeptidase n=1 Tax=Actinoalloteichus spitiensis TaxID=252394 RepID=UPI000375A1F5|nr:M14 family metallocarboxypeptidase [Actinoalloteichus spitiensis]